MMLIGIDFPNPLTQLYLHLMTPSTRSSTITGVPDPTIIQTVPRPDPPFLWLYSLLSLLPPEMETPFLLIAPPIAILILIALPLVAGVGEKSWYRRPVAVLTVLVFSIRRAALTQVSTYTPWSPKMAAWSGTAVPVQFIQKSTPLVRPGANVFQYKQCCNCLALGGVGGERGPALKRNRNQDDERPDDLPGNSGWRQHARVWEESPPT
jgi:ubiquinol-cytochrome c reductase cytochrome b subunit